MFVNDNCFIGQLWLSVAKTLIKKYYIKCLNNIMMLSICKEEVDNLDMKYIINNLIKNVMLSYEMSRDCGDQRLTYWLK